jgi:hypothetical protein
VSPSAGRSRRGSTACCASTPRRWCARRACRCRVWRGPWRRPRRRSSKRPASASGRTTCFPPCWPRRFRARWRSATAARGSASRRTGSIAGVRPCD